MIDVRRQKFQGLFFVLVALVAGYPVLKTAIETKILFDLITTAVFLFTFATVYAPGAPRRFAVALGVPTLIGLWIDYAVPGLPRSPLVIGFHLSATLFLGLTVYTVLQAVYREPRVTADAVYGAFCGYIVVGLIFGHVYCIIETNAPGSFAGNPDLISAGMREDHRYQILTYFSFITLATVGYGDITPGSGPARGLAVAEAITGQFYIAVLVADLIGKQVSQAMSPPTKSD